MEWYIHILIGFLALAGIVVAVINRPITPKLRRWLLEHRLLVERVAPFVLILWGGTIWALLIVKRDYSNVFAMVGGSVIICTGVFFFFFKRF